MLKNFRPEPPPSVDRPNYFFYLRRGSIVKGNKIILKNFRMFHRFILTYGTTALAPYRHTVEIIREYHCVSRLTPGHPRSQRPHPRCHQSDRNWLGFSTTRQPSEMRKSTSSLRFDSISMRYRTIHFYPSSGHFFVFFVKFKLTLFQADGYVG